MSKNLLTTASFARAVTIRVCFVKNNVLRNTYVHETDCLVRLALESKQDDRKLRQFVLNAQDFFFDQDMRKGEALPIAEVLQVTRFGRILYDDWENTYHEHSKNQLFRN